MATVILASHNNFFRNSRRLRNTCPRSQRNQCCSNDVYRERLTVRHSEAQYNLVMENVKILKRGEAVHPHLLIKQNKEEEEEEEEEETLEKHIGDPDVVALFAGCSCWNSPSPSSVPLPHFRVNNGQKATLN